MGQSDRPFIKPDIKLQPSTFGDFQLDTNKASLESGRGRTH